MLLLRSMSMISESRQMLCLSALSYRSFEDPLRDTPHVERVRGRIARRLADLAPVCGDWELVWGPAAYRAPLSAFDDDLVYVVRSRDTAHRYAVVIRGTNPISGFDWLFGDLWVGIQVPWPYGGRRVPEPGISLSTLLGLNVVQLLQAPPPGAGVLDGLRARLAPLVDRVLPDVDLLLRPLRGQVAADLRRVRDGMLPVLSQLDAVRRARPRQSAEAHVLGLRDDWRSASRHHLVERVGEAVRLLEAHGSFNVLRFLEGSARLRAALASGVTLRAFLAAAVEEAAGHPVDVVVTGHSKGGALASTVALWLADTQGTRDVDPGLRWDPHQDATVHCFSFAGPTAGNAAFAAHSDRVLGARCHRVFNPLDVVPHAWETGDLRKIPTLYKRSRPLPFLDELMEEIVERIGDLGYTHVGRAEPLAHAEEAPLPDFLLQVVHQHLAGYLSALELDDRVDVLTFFGPLG